MHTIHTATESGGIKYIPLLLYKCKWPSRQNPSNKLIVIKTPTARTDREIKSQQHQIQHAIQLNKTQDNNICWSQSDAPTVGYLTHLMLICISFGIH